jgi:hypothetical protein
MVAAAHQAASSTNDNEHARRPWSPDRTDHLIFQWVKMEGKTQDWVATQLGVSQPTVSRVVQRYERWQAHAREREGGRLDHRERLRAQRWLTFERNELLLSSCLRIAQEMEGFTDVSKSTIRRGASLTQEREVSTQHATIDRSGVAARFLRLAFRINMEQLKLAELDPPPPAEPLSEEEIAEQDRADAVAAEELAAAWRRLTGPLDQGESSRHPGAPGTTGSEAPAWEPTNPSLPTRQHDGEGGPSGNCVSREDPGNELASPTPAKSIEQPASAAASMHNVNKLHNAEATEFGATPTEPCSCISQPSADKNSPVPCISDQDQPPWPSADRPKGAKRRRERVAAK